MLSWCDNPRSSYVLLSSCEGIGWSFLGATVNNIVVEENKEALDVLSCITSTTSSGDYKVIELIIDLLIFLLNVKKTVSIVIVMPLQTY